MNDPGLRRSRTARRVRIMVGGLIALTLVYVVVSLSPRFLSSYQGQWRPLDRCLTKQAVLQYLDGKTIVLSEPMNRSRSITLRKERISSLKIRSDDPPAIRLRFNLDDQGRRYPVEGEFLFTSIDSPSLHYHSWGEFIGQGLSGR